MPSRSLSIDVAPVLDVLTAMLYVVFLELKESIEDSTLSVVHVDRDKAEHLEMLQNKIFGVRCISYMFSVLWCVTRGSSMRIDRTDSFCPFRLRP